MTATDLEQGAWFATILERALHETEDVGEALLVAEEAFALQPEPPVTDAAFSWDVFNRRAQHVLDEAVKAGKKMSAEARLDLDAALATTDPLALGTAIVDWMNKYRLRLASLLTETQLASLLEGAWEVARHVGPISAPGTVGPPPPTLPPGDIQPLLDRIGSLEGQERWQAIYELPADQQSFVRQSLAAHEASTGSVLFTPPASGEGKTHYPVIAEATKQLSEKNLVTPEVYDRLDAAARQKAFTIAGVDARETLGKVRDALVEQMKEGVDFETFRKRVLEKVEPGTFLSDGHLETVYRANVQGAFSDGQMAVLRHPYIRSGFPYASYDAIHDDRVRHDHLALEHHGIGGSNIYRIDDPVFQTFRPPWDWNDRCAWTPMTIRHAAERGIDEAQRWLESGVEPSPPAFVAMPPFQPPEKFRRAVEGAPLSVRLSLEPLEAADGKNLFLATTSPAEWSGPHGGPRGGPYWQNRRTGKKLWRRQFPHKPGTSRRSIMRGQPAAAPQPAEGMLAPDQAQSPPASMAPGTDEGGGGVKGSPDGGESQPAIPAPPLVPPLPPGTKEAYDAALEMIALLEGSPADPVGAQALASHLAGLGDYQLAELARLVGKDGDAPADEDNTQAILERLAPDASLGDVQKRATLIVRIMREVFGG